MCRTEERSILSTKDLVVRARAIGYEVQEFYNKILRLNSVSNVIVIIPDMLKR